MESTQIQALYEPPPAAMPQLSEKPCQGFETRKTAGKPGSSSCNFTVTLGLRATVVENGVRKTYSARYYNPATGRFLSRDPENGKAKFPVTLHKYLYAGGDSVNWIDPTGRTMADYPVLIYLGATLGIIAAEIGIVQAYCENAEKVSEASIPGDGNASVGGSNPEPSGRCGVEQPHPEPGSPLDPDEPPPVMPGGAGAQL
jgi:RHS repeat-associated protein